MNLQNFSLKTPPIVEAVFDIECDLPPDLDFSTIEKSARDRFSDRYPLERTQLIQEHRIGLKPNEQPSLSSRQAIQAFQFLQPDEKQLVQVRTQGFSFNRLAPYTSFEDYLPEIERTWRVYFDLANPVRIRLIRLRYINRIELTASGGFVHLDDYFKIAPRFFEEENFTIAGFLNQHHAVENDTGNLVQIVLTNQPYNEQKLPIILDMTVTNLKGSEPHEWSIILEKIFELRALKNRIFINSLTDKCLDLYR